MGFWKDRKGKEVSFKQFMKRWKEGIIETTPRQQKRIILWSFMPLFAGIFWGLAVTFLGRMYWLFLILLGSLSMTTIQFISTIQQYTAIKKIDTLMKSMEEQNE